MDQGTSSTAEGEVRTLHPREDEASGSLYELSRQQEDAQESESEVDDPTFDLDASIKSNGEHMAESFCEEWVAHFKNKASLGLFMTFQLQSHLGMGKTEPAELAGIMVGRSERTIREWVAKFNDSGGGVPESRQGHYQRSGVLWSNEDLSRKAARFI